MGIPNTTNALEGGVFSHMKNMISLHRELSKSMHPKGISSLRSRQVELG